MTPPPPPSLLIVDGDPELRRFLQGELEAEGHGVDTGQQALTRIRRAN